MEAELESLKLEHRLNLEQLLQNEAKSKEKNEEEEEEDEEEKEKEKEKEEDEDDDDSCGQYFMPADIQMHMTRAALEVEEDVYDYDYDILGLSTYVEDEDDDDDDDSTMLLSASWGNWKPMFEILEADPTKIGAKTSESNSALHLAARFNDLTVFKRLVGFALNTKDEMGNRILSISDKNNYGDTPLHMAAQMGNPNVAAYLTRKKPRSAYELNHLGFSPLYSAVEHGDVDMVEDMFTALPPSDVPKEILDKVVRSPEASLAHAAIQASNLKMLILLLNHLPSILEVPNAKGWKPLSFAAYECCVKEVGYILKNFPLCVEEPDEDGSFPIHKAIVGGEIGVVETFVSLCPATVSRRDKKQRTILHVAVRYGKMEVLKYLSDKHSDKIEKLLDSRDVDGKTFKDLVK